MRRYRAELTIDGNTFTVDGPTAVRVVYRMCGWRNPRDYFLWGVLAGIWLTWAVIVFVQWMVRA